MWPFLQGCGKMLKILYAMMKTENTLRKIRKEYKNLVRNIWNPFDKNNEKILGCTTVNQSCMLLQ